MILILSYVSHSIKGTVQQAVFGKILFESIALPLQILSEKWIVTPPALLKIQKDLRSNPIPNFVPFWGQP